VLVILRSFLGAVESRAVLSACLRIERKEYQDPIKSQGCKAIMLDKTYIYLEQDLAVNHNLRHLAVSYNDALAFAAAEIKRL
jgi:hypothetical protein